MRILFFFFAFAFLFTGCAYKSSSAEIAEFERNLYENRCDFSLAEEKIKENEDVILWSIQGGSLARNCGEFEKSTQFFDEAELRYKFDVDLKNPLFEATDTAKTLLINANVNSYEGNIYEKTLVNTYKGLNFLALNDKENARVEFNRALERQRIAQEYFQKEILTLNEQNDKNMQELQSSQELYNSMTYALSNGKAPPVIFNENSLDYALNSHLLNQKQISYPDFINPFASYISALFFLNDRSYQRAADLFKEILAADPKNPQVAKDFALSYEMAGKFNANFKEHFVWLIYENGRGAVKSQFNIRLPLFIFSNSFLYTDIALPQLQLRDASFEFLTLKNGSGDSSVTSLISDMDSVEMAEFDKRYFGIAMESIISAGLKTIFQKQMDDVNPALGWLAFFYQVATAEADTRSWSALPKYFMSASIPIKDGNISITDERGIMLVSEVLSDDKNAIIYLKSADYGQIITHKIYF